MPDPGRYKSKSKYMGDCMHQTLKVEGMPRDQAIAVCLNRWREEKGGKKPPKKKKCSSELLRDVIERMAACLQ